MDTLVADRGNLVQSRGKKLTSDSIRAHDSFTEGRQLGASIIYESAKDICVTLHV